MTTDPVTNADVFGHSIFFYGFFQQLLPHFVMFNIAGKHNSYHKN